MGQDLSDGRDQFSEYCVQAETVSWRCIRGFDTIRLYWRTNEHCAARRNFSYHCDVYVNPTYCPHCDNLTEIVNFLFSSFRFLQSAFSGLSMLFAFSAVANNTIGIIYVCPKNVNIRFAYLDLWGYRQHYDTTIDNIAEPGSLSIFGLCQNVELRNGTKTFKLATRHGHILDFDLYEKLFGSLRK